MQWRPYIYNDMEQGMEPWCISDLMRTISYGPCHIKSTKQQSHLRFSDAKVQAWKEFLYSLRETDLLGVDQKWQINFMYECRLTCMIGGASRLSSKSTYLRFKSKGKKEHRIYILYLRLKLC